MDYDIFKTEDEKAEARKVLAELVEHPGWKIIVKALEANAAYAKEQLQNRIENRQDFTSLDQLYGLQDRIDDLARYKELPINILKEILIEDEPEEEDIYETAKTE